MSITSPILRADGRPEPSQELLQRLRAVDPRFAVRFYAAMRQWGVTLDWAEHDARREWIKNGTMRADNAYDLFALLPRDCGVDEACAYLASTLQSHTDARVKATGLALHAANEKHWDTLTQPWVDQIVDDVSVIAVNRRRPTVFMNDTEARTLRVTTDTRRRLT